MIVEEAIKDIKENIKPVIGGISLDMAIEALERLLPKEVEIEEVRTVIDNSGDVDIEDNMLCPTCRSVVGAENENEGLFFDHCPDCGQRLKHTAW